MKTFDNPKSHLLPTLQLAQKKFGYLSREAIDYVAKLMGLPHSKVMMAASFYSMLHKKPVGKYHIQVCTNLSCSMAKSRNIFSYLKKKLRIKEGGVTADKKFTISRVECLGACDKAPSIQINDAYHYNVTLEKIDKLLEECK